MSASQVIEVRFPDPTAPSETVVEVTAQISQVPADIINYLTTLSADVTSKHSDVAQWYPDIRYAAEDVETRQWQIQNWTQENRDLHFAVQVWHSDFDQHRTSVATQTAQVNQWHGEVQDWYTFISGEQAGLAEKYSQILTWHSAVADTHVDVATRYAVIVDKASQVQDNHLAIQLWYDEFATKHGAFEDEYLQVENWHSDVQLKQADIAVTYTDITAARADVERWMPNLAYDQLDVQARHADIVDKHISLQSGLLDLEVRHADVVAKHAVMAAWQNQVEADAAMIAANISSAQTNASNAALSASTAETAAVNAVNAQALAEQARDQAQNAANAVDDLVSKAELTDRLGTSGNLGTAALKDTGTSSGTIPLRGTDGVIPGSISGNAATATKLAALQTLTVTGDATGSASFDGSADAALQVTLANSGATAGTYPKVTVDAKGRVTGGSSLSANDIPTLAISKVSELQGALDGKANTADVNSALAAKANAADVYSKAAVDSALGAKADSSAVYSRADVDWLVGQRSPSNHGHWYSDIGGLVDALNSKIPNSGGPVYGDLNVTGTVYTRVSYQGASGYTWLTNGLILQWGTVWTPQDGTVNFSWPTAFPNGALGAVASQSGEFGPMGDAGAGIYNLTAAGATVKNGAVAATIRFMAIGY